MTVYFEEEGAYQLPFDCRKLAEKVIAEAVDYEQCPYETEVNLLLTMNEEIREMNRQFREIDRMCYPSRWLTMELQEILSSLRKMTLIFIQNQEN